MTDQFELVDIPAKAKQNKAGRYYIMKNDLDEIFGMKGERGLFILGDESDEPGKMIPSWAYYRYCAPDAVAKEKEALEAKRRKEEERERKEAEHEEELRRTFGQEYVSLDELSRKYNHEFHPVSGCLLEKCFGDSGLSDILEEVLGSERAFLVKLSAGVMATQGAFLSYDASFFPLKRHCMFEMDRYLTTSFWKSITGEEEEEVYRRWISLVQPKSVSSLCARLTVTLFHDRYSDGMGSWFGTRVRTGTQYYHSLQLYRDSETGNLLAAENEKHRFTPHYDPEDSSPLYTIHNSDYPELRNASAHFFLPPYFHDVDVAVRKRPTSVWIHVSEYPNQRELGKKLKLLAEAPEHAGFKVLEWQGKWNDTEGTWYLGENIERRRNSEPMASEILKTTKRRLSSMSYYPAEFDFSACYFVIEKQCDEVDIFDNEPFTVKTAPGALAMIRKDLGRFLCFTTEGPYTIDQLIDQEWRGEDILYNCTSYLNHGETSDIAEEFMSAMSGRDLPLFFSCFYRDWIYTHLRDRLGHDFGIEQFTDLAGDFTCTIQKDGTITPSEMTEELRDLLSRFDLTEADVMEYFTSIIQGYHYFHESYQEW